MRKVEKQTKSSKEKEEQNVDDEAASAISFVTLLPIYQQIPADRISLTNQVARKGSESREKAEIALSKYTRRAYKIRVFPETSLIVHNHDRVDKRPVEED